MYERRHQHLIPKKKFYWRLFKNFFIALCILFFSLSLGVVGYHYTEDMPWLDAYVNASMILSGMGPVSTLHTSAGKAFAGSYALFSGVVFLIVIAILVAPLVHRFLHTFHLQEK